MPRNRLEADVVGAPKLLMVTTVPETLRAFLTPYADTMRAAGWTVHAAASGLRADLPVAGHFDAVHDVAFSRKPTDILRLLRAYRGIAELVARESYDIVHVHTPVAALVTRAALRRQRRLTGLKVIYTAHGLHFHPLGSPFANALFSRIESMAARWTDYLITINRADTEAARRMGLVPEARLWPMAGIGVDVERYARHRQDPALLHELRAQLRLPTNGFTVLCVAEFNPGKRHQDLLQAFAGLADPNALLLLVGEGPCREAMQAMARKLGVAEQVRFLGYRRDVPALLALADAFALTSQREGLPRCLLEAMAAEVPCAAYRIRGCEDLLEDEAGWLAEPGDLAGLCAALIEIRDAQELVAARTVNALRKVRADYALPRLLERHQTLYRLVSAE